MESIDRPEGATLSEASGRVPVEEHRSSSDSSLNELSARLASSEERFVTSIDTLIDPLVLLRPMLNEVGQVSDFVYEYANEAACTTNIVAHEELIGMRVLERLTQLAPVGLFDAYAAVIETSEPLALNDFAQPCTPGDERDQRFFDVRALKAGSYLCSHGAT